jgi:hypothetical protein
MMSLIDFCDFLDKFIANRYTATNKFDHNVMYLFLDLLDISLKHMLAGSSKFTYRRHFYKCLGKFLKEFTFRCDLLFCWLFRWSAFLIL